MQWAAMFFAIGWVTWCMLQVGFGLLFRRLMQVRETENVLPVGKANILLAVRGADPSFAACVQSLLEQDHNNFEIHVVVDSDLDPAIDVIRKFEPDPKLHLHVLKEPKRTCGLKCSALISAIDQFDSEPEFLVLVDSDTIVEKNWLKKLLQPLSDSNVGATTGSQWFDPPLSAGTGTMLRTIWHAGAIVPTVMYGNPWAGSLAIRFSDFRRAELREIWQHSIVDDGPVKQAIESLGKTVQHVPTIVVANRETCSIGFVNRYVGRMLTWSRLYEEEFLRTLIHAGLTGSLLISNLVFLAWGVLSGHSFIAGAALGSVCLGMILNLLGYLLVRSPIAEIKRDTPDPLNPVTAVTAFKLMLLSPFAQLLYVKSAFQALARGSITWRDATYRIKSKETVELMGYKPFSRQSQSGSII